MSDIIHSAPLGKSDHDILMVRIPYDSNEKLTEVEPKLNYNKGDYHSLRDYLDLDWQALFDSKDNNLEEIWKTLKEKINEGIEKFIPKVKNLSFLKERNWKTPLDFKMRQNIQEKSKLWNKYKKKLEINKYTLNIKNAEMK